MRFFHSFACALPLVAFGATEFPIEDLGRPFALPTNVLIEWKATNSLPAKVTVYEVAPAEFSPSFLSNLMALGKWKAKDRTDIPGRERRQEDKDILHFGKESEPKQLSFYAPAGLVQYQDAQACAPATQSAHGVPNEAQALELAYDVLKKLQIDERDLAKGTNGTPSAVLSQTTRGRRNQTEVIQRTVNFSRQMDGIPFTGAAMGGVRMSFGNDGKLASLDLVWPRLQPKETRPTASPVQLIEYVKQGKTALRWSPDSDQLSENMPALRRIKVHEVKAYYLGNSMDEMRKVIIPFATLDITAHLPDTNYTVWLNSPLAAPEKK